MILPKENDLVAPFTFGYYTSFWFGDREILTRPSAYELANHGGLFARYDLGRNISAGVFENGLVLFDFSRCENTPIVIHRESLWNDVEANENGVKNSKAVSRRLQRTESRQRTNQAFYRTVLISHALFLENAGRLVGRSSFHLPRIERISDIIGCYGIGKILPNQTVSKFNSKLSRQVVDRSFQDLNTALASGDNFIRSIELHKLSHYRTLDHRFAESLVLSWTVCENIIDFVWNKMIEEIKSSNADRMSKKRRDTLNNPSSFTASVRIEALELSGIISIDEAKDMNEVRNSRNRWLHRLEDVDEKSSLHSIKVCARLISSVFGLNISDTIVGGVGGEGGGMFMENFVREFPNIDLSGAFDG